MNIPKFLSRLRLLTWTHICPKCRKEVKANSHECPHCGEKYPLTLKIPFSGLHDAKKLEAYVHEHVFPRISEFERNYLTQYFTVLFSDSFQSGNFSAWTSSVTLSGTMSVVTSPVYGSDAYSAQSAITSVGGYAMESVTISPISSGYMYCFLMINKLPSGNSEAMAIGPYFYTSSGTKVVRVIFGQDASGNLQAGISQGVGGTVSNTLVAFNWAANTWYCVELYFASGSGSNGQASLWINGQLILNLTNTVITGTVSICRIGASAQSLYGTGWTGNSWYDNVVVADTYIPQAAVQVCTGNLGFLDSNYKKPKVNSIDKLGLLDSAVKKSKVNLVDKLGLLGLKTIKPKINSLDKLGFLDLKAIKSKFNSINTLGLADLLSKKTKQTKTDALGFSDGLTKHIKVFRVDIIGFFDKMLAGKLRTRKVTFQSETGKVTFQSETGKVTLQSDFDN